jgi:hypothetical protein
LLAFAIPSSVTFGWMARNAHRTGVWTLSTDGPIDLYYYKAAGVVWYRSDKSFQTVQEDLGRELGWPRQYYTDVPPSLQPVMIRRAERILLADPAGTMVMTLRCFGWLAIVPVRGSLNEYLGTNAGASSYFAASGNVITRIREMFRSPLLTTIVVLQFLLMMFVWAGVARALAHLSRKSAVEKALIIIPFMLAIALLVLAAGPEAMARYRLPAIPLLAVLAAVGWFGEYRIVNHDLASSESFSAAMN